MPRATKLQKNREGKLVSARAKSGSPECSAAASAFAKLRSGGSAPPDLFSTLAKCRAKARNNQAAKLQREAGNEGKVQVLEKRAERGLTIKDRVAKAKELIAARKAGKATPAKAAGRGTPERTSKAAALRQSRTTMTGDTRPAWLMTTKEHDRLSASLKINASGTGGESKYGMGRSTTEKGFKATVDRAAQLRDRLSGGTTVVRMGGKYAGGQKDAVRGAILKGEPVPAGKAKRLGIDPAKPLAAPGRGTPDRAARARELVASRKAAKSAPATQAKPSLREQADAARAAKGDRAGRVESLRMKAYDTKRKHSNAALNAGRNQSEYLQKAARARTAQSKSDLQNAAGTQSRIASREFDKVGRAQRWTDKLDAARRPQKPAVDRKAEVMARLEQRRAAIQSPEGQAKIAAQRQRAAEKDATTRPLFGAKSKPSPLQQAAAARTAKGDRTTRLKALAERSMSLAESRATRAGSLSGAAQDRMIDRSMAAASRYNALEAARTPYKPAAAPKAEPVSPSLLEQARKAREAKGTREQRVAAIAKRADKIGVPLLRKEQDLTKSFDGYTRAMTRYQSELPWASRNDKGYASEIEKSLSTLRGSIQQAAAKSAKISARVKSLRNRISPLLAKSAR